MDEHPEDAQQTMPDVVTEVAAEPADEAPAEGTPTLDAAAEHANAREEVGGDSVDTIIAPEGAEGAADVAPTEPDAGELSMTDCESDNEPLAAKDELMDSTSAQPAPPGEGSSTTTTTTRARCRCTGAARTPKRGG